MVADFELDRDAVLAQAIELHADKASPFGLKMSSAHSTRVSAKLAPRVALVQLDAPTTETLTRAFAQCGIQTVPVAEDFARRLGVEQFQGCVVQLDDHATAVLEAVRSSRSNRRIILYGILSDRVDLRRFSRYGVNTVLDSPVSRGDALNVARSTCALLLNELRLYVRIPLVIEVSVEGTKGKCSGSSREISGGGMSVQVTGRIPAADKLRLSFTLPEKPPISIGATACWQNDESVGLQFHDSDPGRQAVKDWISSFLGLD